MVTVQAWVGLGANLGDAAAAVRAAVAALDALPATCVRQASGLYSTPAWGNEDQPPFVNAVARIDTGLAPLALLQALQDIETRGGRVRDPALHWGPRLLDLDLLLYGEAVLDLPGLQVPHPWMQQRAFVLVPLAELAPSLRIPGHGTVQDALMQVDTCGIARIGG